jgi:hypothetical protein
LSSNRSISTFSDETFRPGRAKADPEAQRKAALTVCTRVRRSDVRQVLDILGIELLGSRSVSS